MMIIAAKALREGVHSGLLRLPLVTEPIRKHFYDETLEYHPHASLQLLMNDPTLFNKLSTEKLKETSEITRPKRAGLSELSDKRYSSKIQNTWYNPQHFIHVLMYDKFAEDVDSFNINDLKTTESFSITSEGKVDKRISVPDVKINRTSTRDTKSDDALKTSMLIDSEIMSKRPTADDVRRYYEQLKLKKETRKKRGWRKYIAFESKDSCF